MTTDHIFENYINMDGNDFVSRRSDEKEVKNAFVDILFEIKLQLYTIEDEAERKSIFKNAIDDAILDSHSSSLIPKHMLNNIKSYAKSSKFVIDEFIATVLKHYYQGKQKTFFTKEKNTYEMCLWLFNFLRFELREHVEEYHEITFHKKLSTSKNAYR